MEIIIISVIAIAIALFVKYVDTRYKKAEAVKVMETNENNKKYKEENNIPENANLLCCTNITIKDILIEIKWNVFVWKDNNVFNFCGASENDGIRKTTIPIEDIQFYTRSGDCKVEIVTEGGGITIGKAIIGGLVGAIMGYILMGTIGMFVGFGIGALLFGRDKIITKNKEIDSRKTYLNYLENNKKKQIVFTSNGHDVLLGIIPEKEMRYIENNKIIEDNKSENYIYKYIEELAKLRDKGILTEDEFNNKKQLLLDKIQ